MMFALKQVGAVTKGKVEAPTPQQLARVLVNRIRTSYNTGDKRTAVQELHEMNPRDLKEIGVENFVNLFHSLRANRMDEQICDGIMAIITDIVDTEAPVKSNPEPNTANNRSASTVSSNGNGTSPAQLVAQYINAFAKHEAELKGIDTLLCIIQDHSFHSKLGVLTFLILVLQDHTELIPAFSTSQGGLHYLVNLLNCSPDDLNGTILRGEALPLVKILSISDSQVQTMLVYESIFESLLAIIKDNGGVSGGVTVEDCLEIFHHLLGNNTNAQKMFRDQTGFASLLPLLELGGPLNDSACRIIVFTIYLISYFLKSKNEKSEFKKTIDAIAGITYQEGREIYSAEKSILTGLAGVSVFDTTMYEAHIESLKCLDMLAKESDAIKEQLIGLLIDQNGGFVKWANTVAEYSWNADESKGMQDRMRAAAELMDTVLAHPVNRVALAGGLVGEACGTTTRHPASSLMRGIFSPNSIGCAYACHLTSLLVVEPGVGQQLATATYNSVPLLSQALASLKAAIRDGKEAYLIHNYFKLLLSCLPGNGEFVHQLTLIDISFFVETANADNIEAVSVQVLSGVFLGMAKIVVSESLAYLRENRANVAEEWQQREGQFNALERSLRDAINRRIGIDRMSQRINTLKQDAAYDASPLFLKSTPPLWDTHTQELTERCYAQVQQNVMDDAMVQPRGSGEALDEAGGHDAGPDAEALRQITLQQQSDLARLRTELQQARDDVQRAKEGGGQGNTVSEEALSQLRREHLEHEAEWQDKLQQATSRALLLSAELEEERAKSAECAKLLEVEKVLSQDAREADIHDKHAREEENQSLLHTYARLQERLDISDSKLALIQQFAMSDSALKAELDRTGAMRHLDGPLSVPAILPPSSEPAGGDVISRAQYDAVLAREEALRQRMESLENDQCDLFALVGVYHEHLANIVQGKSPQTPAKAMLQYSKS